MGLLCTASAALAEEKVNLGVAVPAAMHGWTGGVVHWANQAKKELEKAHPGLKITVKTAGSAPEQANQLQDLLTVTKIDTLVVLPFESASEAPIWPLSSTKIGFNYLNIAGQRTPKLYFASELENVNEPRKLNL